MEPSFSMPEFSWIQLFFKIIISDYWNIITKGWGAAWCCECMDGLEWELKDFDMGFQKNKKLIYITIKSPHP